LQPSCKPMALGNTRKTAHINIQQCSTWVNNFM
jgi:hypothetical protein